MLLRCTLNCTRETRTALGGGASQTGLKMVYVLVELINCSLELATDSEKRKEEVGRNRGQEVFVGSVDNEEEEK